MQEMHPSKAAEKARYSRQTRYGSGIGDEGKVREELLPDSFDYGS